jgi:hypothetical protein
MPRPNDGYPTSWGSSRASVFPHVGPTSYAVVTYSPLANGDEVSAIEAGMKYFDFVDGMVSDSGNFLVQAIPEAASGGNVGTQFLKCRLKWVALRAGSIGGQTQVAGAEAVATTNLSGETVRFLGIGPK